MDLDKIAYATEDTPEPEYTSKQSIRDLYILNKDGASSLFIDRGNELQMDLIIYI